MTLDQIKADVARKMKAKMDATNREAEAIMYQEVGSYYAGGFPIQYIRTGTLATTPKVTGVSGGGLSVSTTAYLDTGISYYTGCHPSGETVIGWTENGGGGTVGNHGYWARSKEQIIAAFNKYFSSW